MGTQNEQQSDTLSNWQTALAQTDQPEALYRALEAEVMAQPGARLFTVMELNTAGQTARRSYSNQPGAYPVQGEKPIMQDAWSAQVLGRGEAFVAQSIDEIAAVFPDHALIQSLGCESCLNLPLMLAGRVIGTLNLLHEAGYYGPIRVQQARHLIVPGTLCLLAARDMRNAV